MLFLHLKLLSSSLIFISCLQEKKILLSFLIQILRLSLWHCVDTPAPGFLFPLGQNSEACMFSLYPRMYHVKCQYVSFIFLKVLLQLRFVVSSSPTDSSLFSVCFSSLPELSFGTLHRSQYQRGGRCGWVMCSSMGAVGSASQEPLGFPRGRVVSPKANQACCLKKETGDCSGKTNMETAGV